MKGRHHGGATELGIVTVDDEILREILRIDCGFAAVLDRAIHMPGSAAS